mgnify:CR=1 FL=1
MTFHISLARAGFVTALVAVAFGAVAEGHRHHVSGYVGGTTVRDLDHTGATLGIDYEYVLTPRTGVGVVAEYAAGGVDATSIFAVTDVHVTRALVVQVGPGVEFIDGDALAVGRVGAYVEFEFGEFTLAPSLFYDVSEREDSLVYGLIAGRRF